MRATEAPAHIRDILEHDPGAIELLLDIGKELLGKQNSQGSVALFTSILSVMPGSAEAHFYLGKAHLMDANTADAARCLEQALALSPQMAEAAELLKDIE